MNNRKIHIIGASTTADYDKKSFQRGWGEFFAPHVVGATVKNYSIGGYAMKNFIFSRKYLAGKTNVNDISESYWSEIITKIHDGDFVIISPAFVNDMLQTSFDRYYKSDDGEYVLDEWNPTPNSYIFVGRGYGSYDKCSVLSGAAEVIEIVEKMINDVEKRGAKPIALTGTGKYYRVGNDEHNVFDVTQKYKDRFMEFVKDKKYTYVDVAEHVLNMINTLGYTNYMEKYHVTPTGYDKYSASNEASSQKPPRVDNVHYNIDGAKMIGDYIAEALKNCKSEIKQYF